MTGTASEGRGLTVGRMLSAQIKSKNIGRGHINGWHTNWGDWEWDSGRLEEMDYVLAKAAELGVRLIIPILNQDYGDEAMNWVGNHTDLIRMVSPLPGVWALSGSVRGGVAPGLTAE